MTADPQRYEKLERLGEGAMAEVFKARDLRMNRIVALKILHKEHCAESYFRSRLIREAKAIAKIPHENIVKIFDVGEDDENRPYIAMELLHGEFLDSWLQHNKCFHWREVLGIGINLASALIEAHTQGIIHRDIKPANIIWQPEKKQVKLTDFGIAHIATAATAYTQVGQLIGTPQYMSPEQIQGQPADNRSDLFAVGVVMYHLLTGQRPFIGDTLAALAMQITQAKPKPIEKLIPRVPKGLVAIINKLLVKNQKQRYQSAKALHKELQTLRDGKHKKKHAHWAIWTPLGATAIALTVWFALQRKETIVPAPAPPPPPDNLLSRAEQKMLQRNIEKKLEDLYCAKLQISVTENAVANVSGYIANEEDLPRIWDVLDSTTQVVNKAYEISVLAWPYCEVAKIVDPFKTKNAALNNKLSVSTEALIEKEFQNEPLVLDLTTPAFSAYLYIDLFEADGNVRHLYPPAAGQEKKAPASTQLLMGQDQKWQVPKTGGKNMILVLASATPLMALKRQRKESAEKYLHYLHQLLIDSPQEVLADYVTFVTGL